MSDLFKLFGGDKLNDVGLYIREYLNSNPNVKIFVGTDSSQPNKYHTTFVTVVALLKPTKGAHIIYKRENTKKIKDTFSRLWNEVEYSRVIADYIEETINNNNENKIVTIHLDLNPSGKWKSSMVHDAAVGYLKGLGYNVETKPNSWASTSCADWLLKN